MTTTKEHGGSTSSISIYAPLREVHGVGPKLAELFSRKGVDTVEDALYFIPRDYQDRSRLTPISGLKLNESATLKGRVINVMCTRRGRHSRLQVHLSDGTGTIVLVWFHGATYLEKDFKRDAWFLVHGDVKYFGGLPSITHPDYEALDPDTLSQLPKSANFGRIVPLYSETEGLTQKVIRKIVAQALKRSLDQLGDPLPQALRNRLQVPTLRESFISVHFPAEVPPVEGYSPAIKRIIFEEFFVLQLGLGLKKQKHRTMNALPLQESQGNLSKFIKGLPFALTGDQSRALEDILGDLRKREAMVRLIQGDVGSGKTVVALAAAVVAATAGAQSTFMAPTEILAIQHFKSAKNWLEPLGIKVGFLAQATENKTEVLADIASGKIQVIIGTHAIFQKGVEFKNLGLVVVDEQHRFGVEQRGQLLKKGSALIPHLLMMTATPIPRTLALTLYGDLDLTLVKEKPVGRKPILTRVIRERDRPQLYSKIRSVVGRGEQVYIIYPLVDVSEKLDLKSATEMHAKLSKEIFPTYSVALLHGRMKPEEKERTLREFKEGKHQILISTTVIEVGIDVANATLMVIEHPERLGLSQLHQLRGRVGRGEKSSECLLVADTHVGERLKVMERTEDGFEIAEEDLKIRGPGEFLGTRQSGLPGFRVGHLLKDAELLILARKEADAILDRDPKLEDPEHAGLRAMVESRWKEKIQRLRGG